jgi:hypothetical protein
MSFADFIKVGIVADDKTKKGISSAEKNIQGLTKGVKNLGKTFATVFAAQKIANFGQAAVKAFMDDQKAAAQLSNTVKNLGLAFADADIQKFIEQLSLATGVVDDELRPAMQKLLQVTGSVTRSQDLLKNAISISAGSGVDLGTVVSDLSNAYVGNNKGLKKYALGLTAAELKTASFDKVITAFNKNFSGAEAAYLETYAGKMQKLTTAAGEAQEKIGGALIDALMNLSGSTGIDDLISKMNTLTDSVVTFLDKFGEGVGILNAIRNSSLGTFSQNIQKVQVDAYNRRMKRDYMKAWEGVNIPKTKEQIAAAKKAEDAAKKRARDILAAQNKNTAELKKQAALKKAGTIFDMEQIQLVAALKGKLSDEERKRVELQIALLNENDVIAAKLSKDILMAQDATGGLYQYFLKIGDTSIKNPFAFLDEWIKNFQTKLNALTLPDLSKPSAYTGAGLDPALAAIGVKEGYGAGVPMTVANQASTLLGNGSYGMQSTAGFVSTQAVTGSNVQVYVSGSVVTEQELIDAIQAGLQSNSLSGAPSQIGRIAGMFG